MRVVLSVVLLVFTGCLTPPAVREAGLDEVKTGRLPPGTVRVELTTAGGKTIRGFFTPSEPSAPVVVHLLGSGGSVTRDYMIPLVWAMRDRGFSSLAVDYRGVGASSGTRSPNHLRADARAIWREARRRAGLDGRVVLRGMSLGTLAACGLLDDGVRPAAAILVSPVRGETVSRNWLVHNWWDGFAYPASLLFRSVTNVDLVETLAAAEVPLLVYLPSRDRYLPPREAALVRRAVREAGGELATRAETGHLGMITRALTLLEEEDALYARLFPGLPPRKERFVRTMAALNGAETSLFADPASRARLESITGTHLIEPALLAAALALEPVDDADRERDRFQWIRRVDADWLAGLPLDTMRALVSLDDPAGPLDARELGPLREQLEQDFRDAPVTAEQLAQLALDRGLARRAVYTAPLPPELQDLADVASMTVTVDRGRGFTRADQPARLDLPEADSLRQVTRLLLKAAYIPERVVDGHIEYWNQGAWHLLP